MSKTKTTEQFIEEAKKIYGDSYDYSLVDYKNSHEKVKIICPIHGIFEQIPYNHLRGKKCLKCAQEISKQQSSTIRTTKNFIEDAIKKYGDSYNYSLVDYKNRNTKIKIICNKCKRVFEQIARYHLEGNGCPFCARNQKKNTEQFIEDAKKVHGDKYDYSLVDYKDTHTKVKIICPTHGVFEQRPLNHLTGEGCSYCCESHGEKAIVNYFKKYNIEFEREKKFNNCKNIFPLRFDFYLPKLNTCIEYDGKQHFEPVKIWGGESHLKYTKRNDKIKTDYCLNNHIRIIRIRYWETVENILDLYFKTINPLD